MLDELIKECEKSDFLCLKDLEEINNYGIFIDTQEVYNSINKNQDKLLALLLASQDDILKNCVLDQINTLNVKLENKENIENTVRVLQEAKEWNYKYHPKYVILIFTNSGSEGYYSIYKYHLKLKDDFCKNLDIKLDSNIIENKFIIKKDTLKFKENLIFSTEQIKSNILRQLERRYSFYSNLEFTNDINDKTKIITIMDKNILRTISYENYKNKYSKDCVLINPNMSYFAKSIKQEIPINHLLALFDVTEKEILNILKKVKSLSNPIVSIGLGGLMSNFFYWCYKLKEYFDLNYLFKQIVVFEYDNLEFSNLFRIPLNWKDRTINRYFKDNLIRQFDSEYRNNNNIEFKKIELQEELLNLSPKVRLKSYQFNHINLKNSILIGGPDLDTRLKIYDNYSKSDIYFLCATHKNNTIKIDSFPKFDRELVVETYGTLDLNRFLLSMFKTTIELLKILGNKEFKQDTFEHLKWQWKDNNFIENSKKHKCLNNIAYAIN